MAFKYREIGYTMWIIVVVLWLILGYLGYASQTVSLGMVIGHIVTALILSFLISVWTKKKESMLYYVPITLIILALGAMFAGLIDWIRGLVPV